METFTLTLKGLLSITIKDEDVLNKTMDSLELYMRRHYAKGGNPAIVLDLDENKFQFTTLQEEKIIAEKVWSDIFNNDTLIYDNFNDYYNDKFGK